RRPCPATATRRDAAEPVAGRRTVGDLDRAGGRPSHGRFIVSPGDAPRIAAAGGTAPPSRVTPTVGDSQPRTVGAGSSLGFSRRSPLRNPASHPPARHARTLGAGPQGLEEAHR